MFVASQSSGHVSNAPSSQSQPSQPASQTPAVPPFPSRHSHPQAIESLLNSDTPSKPSTAVSNLIIDLPQTNHLLESIVHNTSGSSVEQLEQIYSALMDKIWKTRGNWNRAVVAVEVRNEFDDVMDDIRFCQELGESSLEIEG